MAVGLSIASTSNLGSGQKILVANASIAFEPAAPDPDLVRHESIPQGHKQWAMMPCSEGVIDREDATNCWL